MLHIVQVVTTVSTLRSSSGSSILVFSACSIPVIPVPGFQVAYWDGWVRRHGRSRRERAAAPPQRVHQGSRDVQNHENAQRDRRGDMDRLGKTVNQQVRRQSVRQFE